MVVQSPTETRVNLSNTSLLLSELVDQVARDGIRVVVEEDGKPIAAIISAKEFERFRRREAERARRFEVLDRISDALDDLTVEEIEAEVERTIAETRALYRADSAVEK